ncbi:MAG: PilN domain-containing protein [Nitrospirae bacterium]|nr:PilN domain-containing protein [Nitrospirota bacterium]
MKSHINLMARDIMFEEKPFPLREVAVPLIAVAAVAAVVLFSVWGFYRSTVLKREVRDLGIQRDKIRQEMALVNGEVGKLTEKTTVDQTVAASQMAAMKDLLKNRVLWSEVIREISFLAPEGVWLIRMESLDSKPGGRLSLENPKTVRFAGWAQSQAAVNLFIAALERSPRYATVSLVYSQKGAGEGMQGVSFELTAMLRP